MTEVVAQVVDLGGQRGTGGGPPGGARAGVYGVREHSASTPVGSRERGVRGWGWGGGAPGGGLGGGFGC